MSHHSRKDLWTFYDATAMMTQLGLMPPPCGAAPGDKAPPKKKGK